MKYRALAIAAFLSLIPLGKVYGYSQSLSPRNNSSALSSNSSNKSKTANDYLDEASLIIENETYLPIYENKNGERDKFIQLVNNSLKLKESARGYFYLGIAGHMSFTSTGYEEAVQNYEKAIQLNPEYIEAFIAMGSVNLNRKNYQECVNSFEQALKLDPKHEVAKRMTNTCKTSLYHLSMRECLSDYEERWRRDPESKVVKARREYCEDLLSKRVTAQYLNS